VNVTLPQLELRAQSSGTDRAVLVGPHPAHRRLSMAKNLDGPLTAAAIAFSGM